MNKKEEMEKIVKASDNFARLGGYDREKTPKEKEIDEMFISGKIEMDEYKRLLRSLRES